MLTSGVRGPLPPRALDHDAPHPLRHAPHRAAPPRQLHGGPRQLGAPPGLVRLLLHDRGLALPDHGLRRPLGRSARTSSRWPSTGWPPGSIPRAPPSSSRAWCPEHAELHLLLSMITPGALARAGARPTRSSSSSSSEKDLSTYGFLGYPLLQTADIIIYKADAVPVGEDQAAARRADARGGAPLQQPLRAGLPRAEDAATPRPSASPAPTAARCRSRTATRST